MLNSKNKFKESEKTLEEYIRKSEKADHTSWEDYNVNNKDLNIETNLENAKNTVSSSMEKLENTFNQFDNFSNQLKNSAKEDISKLSEGSQEANGPISNKISGLK